MNNYQEWLPIIDKAQEVLADKQYFENATPAQLRQRRHYKMYGCPPVYDGSLTPIEAHLEQIAQKLPNGYVDLSSKVKSLSSEDVDIFFLSKDLDLMFLVALYANLNTSQVDLFFECAYNDYRLDMLSLGPLRQVAFSSKQAQCIKETALFLNDFSLLGDCFGYCNEDNSDNLYLLSSKERMSFLQTNGFEGLKFLFKHSVLTVDEISFVLKQKKLEVAEFVSNISKPMLSLEQEIIVFDTFIEYNRKDLAKNFMDTKMRHQDSHNLFISLCIRCDNTFGLREYVDFNFYRLWQETISDLINYLIESKNCELLFYHLDNFAVHLDSQQIKRISLISDRTLRRAMKKAKIV